MITSTRRQLLAGAAALATTTLIARWGRAAEEGKPHLRVVQPWEFNTLDPAETGYLFNRACATENLVATQPVSPTN